jgi:hypothetical protein
MHSYIHNDNEFMLSYRKLLPADAELYATCMERGLSSRDTLQVKFNDDIKSNYIVELRPEYIFKRAGLSFGRGQQVNGLNCNLTLFDKQMNTSDLLNNLVYTHVASKELRGDDVLTFTVNKSGFYLVECWLFSAANFSTKSTIYEEVISILPKNMSEMVEAQKPIRQLRDDEMKSKHVKQILAKNKNLLAAAEFEECNNGLVDEELADKMSVLIIAIDSTSYPYVVRQFPLTHAYLTSVELKNNVMMENFNIVGLNTYPNILPMQSGVLKMSNEEWSISDEATRLNAAFESNYHDLYPLIWYEYEQLGYVTMYNEDWGSQSTFNGGNTGFKY